MCVVLLINADSFEDFQNILIDILTVVSSRHYGPLLDNPNENCLTEIAFNELKKKIKGRYLISHLYIIIIFN